MPTNESFITEQLATGRRIAEQVRNEFALLTPEQLNWKPGTDAWSIGQCLDHLINSDLLYFPSLKKIAAGDYKMSFWQKWNPFSVLFGRMLVNQIQPTVKKKYKSPAIFLPAASTVDAGIVVRFLKHQDTLLEYIAACTRTHLDRTHISSPLSPVVSFSLRNALKLLLQHEQRHVNQAIRVKSMPEFPG